MKLIDRERQIPLEFTYMWNLKNNNKKKQQQKWKQTHKHREHFRDTRWDGAVWEKKRAKGLRDAGRWLQSRHGDVEYSMG